LASTNPGRHFLQGKALESGPPGRVSTVKHRIQDSSNAEVIVLRNMPQNAAGDAVSASRREL
jgi:hypothetical protein